MEDDIFIWLIATEKRKQLEKLEALILKTEIDKLNIKPIEEIVKDINSRGEDKEVFAATLMFLVLKGSDLIFLRSKIAEVIVSALIKNREAVLDAVNYFINLEGEITAGELIASILEAVL